MHKKVIYFLTGIALATAAISAHAQSTVASVPEGMFTFTLLPGSTNYLSLPLINNETYTGSVSAVSAETISVGDTPAPFTANLATSAAPYFVKFLSGNEMGRVLLVTANSATTLTLSTTDHSTGLSVLLTTIGFDVEVGDTFEIFPGDTLASVFGADTTQSPLLLTGGKNGGSADSVALFTESGAPTVNYYFNTTTGQWEQQGRKVNANDTIIYPYSALTIKTRPKDSNTTLVLAGRVTPVLAAIKVVGHGTAYTSTHYATDITLSQLQFGSNWVTGTKENQADTLSVWNATENKFDTYYQLPDLTWRKSNDALTDRSNFAITAGTVTTITMRSTVSGASTFLQTPLPYCLD